jgi:hypothetical protein
MSAAAIRAWYMDMCVNAPRPVMSPMAHSLSAARMRSSTVMPRAVSSSPTAPTPSFAMSVRRPAATSMRSAWTTSPLSSFTTNPLDSKLTRAADSPVRTVMPSASNVADSRSPASGSSAGTSRSACCTTVTAAPKRENT